MTDPGDCELCGAPRPAFGPIAHGRGCAHDPERTRAERHIKPIPPRPPDGDERLDMYGLALACEDGWSGRSEIKRARCSAAG